MYSNSANYWGNQSVCVCVPFEQVHEVCEGLSVPLVAEARDQGQDTVHRDLMS